MLVIFKAHFVESMTTEYSIAIWSRAIFIQCYEHINENYSEAEFKTVLISSPRKQNIVLILCPSFIYAIQGQS